ncbi:RB-associated KRAB zinc finger protein [Folsomia candida]|uniref:RB-associated KRAB zinc finger protein n=1 Tax=Folsomia candida TaxID=158441 RepID=A0A226E7L3_FOLCA|nr:RB-associated KRAB zinc finger protein [Folsomia candida]
MLTHVRRGCAKARELGLDVKFLAEQKAQAESRTGKSVVIRDGLWTREICGVGFQHKGTVEVHRREFHPEVLPAHCPDCGKRYRTEYVMRKHRRLVHRVEEPQEKKLDPITTEGKGGMLRGPVVCEEVEILVESCNDDVKDMDPLKF